MTISRASCSKLKRDSVSPNHKGSKSTKASELDEEDDKVEHFDIEEYVRDLCVKETTISRDESERDDDGTDVGTEHHKEGYTILSEDDIPKHREKDVAEISSVLSVSSEWANILLHHHNWDVCQVPEAWFADEEKVRSSVGLVEKSAVHYSNDEELTCGICFGTYCQRSMHAVDCGHPFCTSCWEGYISSSINDGPGCLTLRCPDPSCSAAVGQDMINMLASDEDKERYSRYLLRSYVEDNINIKRCPAPGCKYALKIEVGNLSYDVTCKCTYSFCWICLEEVHRPVNCDTAAKWILMNTAESGNKAKKEGVYEESEQKPLMDKKHLERYTNYHEKWAANQSSRQKAIEELHKLKDGRITKLRYVYCQPKSQLEFIRDAWLQIIECRRVLNWIYAYGYFLPEEEHVKRQLFEYVQGEAEHQLELLHRYVELNLKVYLQAEQQLESFEKFRINLVRRTHVTRKYFKNLAQAVENGLADVASVAVGSSKDTEGDNETKMGIRLPVDDQELNDLWICEHCTYYNGMAAPACEMCSRYRVSWSCVHCTYLNNGSVTVCEMCNEA